jgi:hypothetical protein
MNHPQIIHMSPRMEITRSEFTGFYTIQLTDEKRLRQGLGRIALTAAEMVELWRLDDPKKQDVKL